MDRKQLILVISITLTICGILLIKNGKSSRSLSTETAATVSSDSDNPSSVSSTPEDTKIAERQLAWTNSERKAFLKRMPLESKDGVAQIHMTVSLLKRCEPGDLDAIRLDFKKDRRKRLKISLENLESEKETTSFELPGDFLEKEKFEHTFSIPISENPSQYGFFVCSTTANEKCSNKEFIDINDIFVEHYNNKEYTPKDRLYFFQLALIDDRGLAAFAIHPKGDQPFQEIETYLQERGISAVDAKKRMGKSKNWTHTLGSLPVKFTEKSIEIEIPQYSEEACGQTPTKE